MHIYTHIYMIVNTMKYNISILKYVLGNCCNDIGHFFNFENILITDPSLVGEKANFI